MGLKEVGKRNFGKGSNSPRWEGEFAEAGNNRFLKKSEDFEKENEKVERGFWNWEVGLWRTGKGFFKEGDYEKEKKSRSREEDTSEGP